MEFKLEVREPRRLARDLAAFANARGGVLVLGVGESDGEAVARGVDPQRTAAIVERAAAMITPQLQYSGRELVVDGKTVYGVEVPEQPEKPFMADGQFYVRQGASSVVATPELISSLVVQQNDSPDLLHAQLESFGEALIRQGELIKELREASTWPRQLLWTLIGAVLGAVLGVVATILTR